MLSRVTLFFVSCFMLLAVNLQGQEKKIVQFSGIITSSGAQIPVPYVTVTNESHNNQSLASNHEGFFSFVAHEGDTIRFSSVGYESLTFVVPKVAGDKYTASISMNSLITEIEAVMPYPWASIEEFNIAFLALDLGDDDVLIAQKNISPEKLAALAQIVPRSPDEIQNFNASQRHIQMSNKNMSDRFSNPIFSPIAWGSLINSISKGDFSRKKPKY